MSRTLGVKVTSNVVNLYDTREVLKEMEQQI